MINLFEKYRKNVVDGVKEAATLCNPANWSFRFVLMGLGSIVIVLIMVLTDPDSGLRAKLPIGSTTFNSLLVLGGAVLYGTVHHVFRKGFFDYVDFEKVMKKAMETSQGAGLFSIGFGLAMISLAIVIHAATR